MKGRVQQQATTDEVAMNDTCPREQVAQLEGGKKGEDACPGKAQRPLPVCLCPLFCVAQHKSISLPFGGNKQQLVLDRQRETKSGQLSFE